MNHLRKIWRMLSEEFTPLGMVIIFPLIILAHAIIPLIVIATCIEYLLRPVCKWWTTIGRGWLFRKCFRDS